METTLGEEVQDRLDLYKKSNIMLLINKFVWSRGNDPSSKKLIMTDKGRGERGKKIRRFALQINNNKDGGLVSYLSFLFLVYRTNFYY